MKLEYLNERFRANNLSFNAKNNEYVILRHSVQLHHGNTIKATDYKIGEC